MWRVTRSITSASRRMRWCPRPSVTHSSASGRCRADVATGPAAPRGRCGRGRAGSGCFRRGPIHSGSKLSSPMPADALDACLHAGHHRLRETKGLPVPGQQRGAGVTGRDQRQALQGQPARRRIAQGHGADQCAAAPCSGQELPRHMQGLQESGHMALRAAAVAVGGHVEQDGVQTNHSCSAMAWNCRACPPQPCPAGTGPVRMQRRIGMAPGALPLAQQLPGLWRQGAGRRWRTSHFSGRGVQKMAKARRAPADGEAALHQAQPANQNALGPAGGVEAVSGVGGRGKGGAWWSWAAQ